MDRISLLPDDFILHILSLLPTKNVLTTSVLSKRWRYLWKLVSKLTYFDTDDNTDHGRFVRFVDRSLFLNTAPVLESLHFKLDRQCSEVDIGLWIRIVAERGLRELNFEYSHMIAEPCKLPRSLYTCGTLVALKLQNVSLVDVRFPVCFHLLKTLHLDTVIFLDDESPKKLLSSCPALEVLELDRGGGDNVYRFSVIVPSLQRFIYSASGGGRTELVVNTPSLKYFKTFDLGSKYVIEYLPEIVEAHVEVICSNTDDILRSLASLKRLLSCLPREPRSPTGCVFHQLEQLEFCTCETEWDALISMLQHSPKLRSLKLNEIHDNFVGCCTLHWDEPSSVPETLALVLETFEWRNYRGWEIERELASFILKHSRRLKSATFSPTAYILVREELCTTTLQQKYGMITELSRLPRGSAECELVFC
ncbi:unnamed protein product [Microthlaspi erraticum]|uniref:F-box domain-containing protein n=1 Tax=Microthlaspi erraticum TaxID=1685480 RepID=A0A6D2LM77_9BRAS|nr:unnamed protein product [Microthlaspi erraticum]